MPNLCAIHLWLLRAAKMGTLSGAKITSSAASATHLLTADTLGQSSPSHLRKLRVCVRITSGAKLKSPLIYNLPQKDSQDLWGSVGLILQIAFQKSWSHRWSYFILKLFPVGRNNTKSPVIFIYIFFLTFLDFSRYVDLQLTWSLPQFSIFMLGWHLNRCCSTLNCFRRCVKITIGRPVQSAILPYSLQRCLHSHLNHFQHWRRNECGVKCVFEMILHGYSF